MNTTTKMQATELLEIMTPVVEPILKQFAPRKDSPIEGRVPQAIKSIDDKLKNKVKDLPIKYRREAAFNLIRMKECLTDFMHVHRTVWLLKGTKPAPAWSLWTDFMADSPWDAAGK